MAKDWIKDANLKKGALRKTLGVKKDEKIPLKKLNEAAKGKFGKKTEKRAELAKTFRKMSKKD